MKLISKYNRSIVLVTIIIIIISGLCYTFIIRHALITQLDNSLKEEEQEILDYVSKHDMLPSITQHADQTTTYELTKERIQRKMASRDVYDSTNKEFEPERQLHFPLILNNRQYKVIVSRSQVETEDLIILILVITSGISALLLVALFAVNRFVLKKLWLPFHYTLEQIKRFNVSGKEKVHFIPTDIAEFKDLNNAFDIMTAKAIKDYELLKDFTDNASHEMQTPLAIINSKLDVLIQDEKVSEHQMYQLQEIYNSVSRLTKLNHSLLLLTKIENNQFSNIEPLNIKNVVEQKIQSLYDWIEGKHLLLTTEINNVLVDGDPVLIEILVSNLITNAIRHNKEGGNIHISLTPANKFIIQNSGNGEPLNKDTIFDKFKKGARSDGAGLGLAITKEICNLYGFFLKYRFINNQHEFSIAFA